MSLKKMILTGVISVTCVSYTSDIHKPNQVAATEKNSVSCFNQWVADGYGEVFCNPACNIFAGGVLGMFIGGGIGGICNLFTYNDGFTAPAIGGVSGAFGTPIILYCIGGGTQLYKKYYLRKQTNQPSDAADTATHV